MRIVVLGLRGVPGVQGGVETHAEHLYPRLAGMGCQIEILTRSPFSPHGKRAFGAIRLRRLWSPRRRGIEAMVHSFLGVLYASVRRPDVLHVHAVGPALVVPLARLLGLRVVFTHHGADYEREKWGAFARAVLRMGEWAGTRFANERIAVSRSIADVIGRRYGRDFTFIPNGVPIVEKRADATFVESLGLTPGMYVLQVSRIVPEKRQIDLINAFAKLGAPQWRLVLVGATDDSEYAAAVQAAAKSHGAVMAGFQTGDALRELYSHAGVFVLPSSHEGLPIVLLEALSYGCRVLASDIPANREVGLPGEDYFRVGDVNGLAQSLSRQIDLKDDPAAGEARKQLVATRYNWDSIAKSTLEVYEKIVRRRDTG